MGDEKKRKSGRDIRRLIYDFCSIILTKKDCLDSQEAVSYIKGLTNEEKSTLNKVSEKDENICGLVKSNVIDELADKILDK